MASVPHSLSDLTGFTPRHASFVGIDSDGCVFDTMEIKQKQCFHGLIASHWGLEAIEQPVRRAAEFVNLYSRWRGQNRYVALLKVFDVLKTHPEARNAPLPELADLRRYVAHGGKLADADLAAAGAESTELRSLLSWSRDVNAAIARTVKDIPPFAWARRSLARIHGKSDAICVSQTPTEALVREWAQSGLTPLIALIAGQELGTKTEHLRIATGGRYAPGRVLMIGDAPGDHQAATEAGALFYPINPAREESSWERFCMEAYDRFLAGTYGGAYEADCIREFDALLPEQPPWLQGGG
jgi:phosphoglycolate phosphatase-like HAD superfamily hydrolase